MFFNIKCVLAETYHKFYFKKSAVYTIREDNGHLISVHSSLKGHKSGINCSYFNMNTRKMINPGDYNRPFIIVKNGNVSISDNKKDLVYDKDTTIVSGGAWIYRDGKPYRTNDHFSKEFKGMLVRRTCLGVGKDNKVYLIVMKNANFHKLEQFASYMKFNEMINLDGGTSSILKFNGHIIIHSKRNPVNFLSID